MRIFFILLLVILTIYFILKKRNIDLFTLAYGSSVIYFSPGLVGFVYYPFTEYKIVLLNETYLIYCIVLFLIFVFAFINDFLFTSERNTLLSNNGENNKHFHSFLIISIVSFILMLFTTGDALFSENKRDVLGSLNRWRYIWNLSLTFCILYAVYYKKKVSIIILLYIWFFFDVYIGFRSSIVMCILANIILVMIHKSKTRIIYNYKLIILSIFTLFIFLVYKKVYSLIKLGEWETVIQLLTSKDLYYSILLSSEPSTTQLILNEVIKYNFSIGIEYWKGIFNLFVIFSEKLGAESVSFNSQFQPILFPNINWGMANNFWAEMYSIGNYLMVGLMGSIYCLIILLLNRLILTVTSYWNLLYIMIGVYLAFYIHRNDIQYMLNLEKRVFLIFIIGIVFGIIFKVIKGRRKYD